MKLVLVLSGLFALRAAAASISGGEWFINDDPGRGLGTPVPVTPATQAAVQVTIPPAVAGSLPPGIHMLGVRMLDDAGQWSHTVWQPFYREAPVVVPVLAAGEWFTGQDPGPGNGTPVSLTPSASATLVATVPASTISALEEGVHQVGVRLRDSTGAWSQVSWQTFWKQGNTDISPEIASFHYRIFRDGGEVTAGTITAPPGQQQMTISHRHGRTGLELDSSHVLQITPVDARGRHGHAIDASFLYRRYAQAWLEKHFTETERGNPDISGDAADPDGDGISNAQERLAAMNPRNPADAAMAGASIRKKAGTADLVLGFRVPGGGTVGTDGIYRTGSLSFSLLQNENLGLWGQTPASWITSWSLDETPDGGGSLQLQVTAPPSSRRFFTLEGTEGQNP